jgi:type IV fimbrial biogenesis protein FimT
MRRRTAGFTLVEMIVTVLIIAILTTFGFQAYQSVVTSTRMSGVINSLLGTLALARSEAMKRGQPVSVCPVASPSATITTCSPTTTVWMHRSHCCKFKRDWQKIR